MKSTQGGTFTPYKIGDHVRCKVDYYLGNELLLRKNDIITIVDVNFVSPFPKVKVWAIDNSLTINGVWLALTDVEQVN